MIIVKLKIKLFKKKVFKIFTASPAKFPQGSQSIKYKRIQMLSLHVS